MVKRYLIIAVRGKRTSQLGSFRLLHARHWTRTPRTRSLSCCNSMWVLCTPPRFMLSTVCIAGKLGFRALPPLPLPSTAARNRSNKLFAFSNIPNLLWIIATTWVGLDDMVGTPCQERKAVQPTTSESDARNDLLTATLLFPAGICIFGFCQLQAQICPPQWI